MYLVVGSGPAGIACAHRLLQAGAKVTMLDVGVACEPDRIAVVERLRTMTPDQWDKASASAIASPLGLSQETGVPAKLIFGSAFPYVRAEDSLVVQHGTRCAMSWATGGLSNVWGAAMLPFCRKDLADWPIDLTELEPHYGAIERLVGLTGVRDRLEGLYPYYAPPARALSTSTQATRILDRMERNANSLQSRGILFGRSRLAVSAEGCRLCQRCLTGCVYDAIYSATWTLRQLQATSGFIYLRGSKVLTCRDDGAGTTISFREESSGTVMTIHGRRSFVAAGVLATTRIIVQSLGLARAKLSLAFHPYFLIPMLMAHNEVDATREKLHALAQIFLEIDNAAISKSTVHAQLYSYNPLFADRFNALGKLGSMLKPSMLGRLVALQGFLHSNEADPIQMQVDVDAASSTAGMTLNGALRSGTKRIMHRVRNELTKSATLTGLLPIPLTMEIGTPGDGNHIGCVFPMSHHPRGLQSDTLGRVGGMARVHAVDASILPSIPASTITFSVMANAHRIAEAALLLD